MRMGGQLVESDQHPFCFRQIADDLLHGPGQLAHKGGQREDLIFKHEVRILQEIDDDNPVFPLHVCFARLLQM